MHFEAFNTERPYVKVANQLARLIVENRIGSEGLLPSAQDLAGKLDASPTTAQDAILALALSGFVKLEADSGITISESKVDTQITDRGMGLFELLRAQLKFEAQACGLAASRITEDQITALKQTLQEILNQSESFSLLGQAHRQFHCLIAEACHNHAVYSVVDWLWELHKQSEICRFFFQKLRQDQVGPSTGSVVAIIEALEMRDAEAAQTAMQEHLGNIVNGATAYFHSLQPQLSVEV